MLTDTKAIQDINAFDRIVQDHLQQCRDCMLYYSFLKDTLNAIEVRRTSLKANDFTSTRVSSLLGSRYNFYKRKRPGLQLQPVLLGFLIFVAVLMGIFIGNKDVFLKNDKTSAVIEENPDYFYSAQLTSFEENYINYLKNEE